MSEVREHANEVLMSVELSKEEANKVEYAIYNRISKDFDEEDNNNFAFEYKKVLYQVVGDVLQKKDVETIVNGLSQGKIGWKHNAFDNMKIRLDEQDEFIKNPFEVEEGVLECMCGSKRVYSYQKQTRGSDEPSTTFAECVACKKKWQYSG